MLLKRVRLFLIFLSIIFTYLFYPLDINKSALFYNTIISVIIVWRCQRYTCCYAFTVTSDTIRLEERKQLKVNVLFVLRVYLLFK
jgi:hypothetical protein